MRLLTLRGSAAGAIEIFHVGDMMYAEGRDVRPGRILDLPLSRLNSLRRAAFKDIIAATSPPDEHANVIVNCTLRSVGGTGCSTPISTRFRSSSRT